MSTAPDIRRNTEGDGLVATVNAHDGAEIEIQLLDENEGSHARKSAHTWELLWSRGTEVTLHHLSVGDVRQIAAVLTAFADCIEAQRGIKAERQ